MGIRVQEPWVGLQLRKPPALYIDGSLYVHLSARVREEGPGSLMWHRLPWMTALPPVLSIVRSKVVNPVFPKEPLRDITVILFARLGAQPAPQHQGNGRDTDSGLPSSDGLSKDSTQSIYGEIIAQA